MQRSEVLPGPELRLLSLPRLAATTAAHEPSQDPHLRHSKCLGLGGCKVFHRVVE